MKTVLLRLLLIVLVALPGLGAELSPEDAACLGCHGPSAPTHKGKAPPQVDAGIYGGSVHAAQGCISCHADLAEIDHPGKTAAKPVSCTPCHTSSEATYTASAHAVARRAGTNYAATCADCHGTHDIVKGSSPDSPVSRGRLEATCGKCHDEIVKEVGESTHGQALARGVKEAPSCIDCHSEHQIESLKNRDPQKIAAEVCSRCHGSAKINTKFNLPTDRVSSFNDSYHGLAGRMGSKEAANCASCHGFHRILPSSDPRSSVHPANLAQTCQKCHPGATERFTSGRIHQDPNAMGTLGDRINTWVRRSYLGMIYLVVGGMALHNLLALWKKARRSLRDPDRTVVRMNLAARLQHGTLALSFIFLVISGFALKYPDSILGALFAYNEPFRRISHRVAAVLMMVLSVVHVFYALGTREGRTFVKDMLPERKDVTDLVQNLRHFLHPRAGRPKLGRFGYAEKAEYWAVVWGTGIMGVTGLMIWFKMPVTEHLPRWVVDIATTIHLYEAILATLAIIAWHFYFVFFDPDIYPINWAWLDGRVNREHHRLEHPLDEPEEVPGSGEEVRQELRE